MATGDGKVTIDCTDCIGKSDIGDRDCFKGVARRIQPGFKGEVILSRLEEKGYSGGIVDVLTDYSDILSLLSGPPDADGEISRTYRKLSTAREKFLEDPSDFLGRGPGLKNKLKGDDASRILDEVLDRTSLMIRKLKMEQDGN